MVADLPLWWEAGGFIRFPGVELGEMCTFCSAGPRVLLYAFVPCRGLVAYRPRPGEFEVLRFGRWCRVGK
jgi:hypothetical protein